ncbi:DUF411 domain-containing protein [Microbaculum sp. FT89]|uniref:DUF411 domain-containing protein n=1 Tax=Microbaculum sp. FT89 TaxID=3447298 RepID=UPI003F53A116
MGHQIDRRTVLTGLGALAVTSLHPWPAAAAPTIHVVKTSGCGCCIAWIDYLRENGFEVTSEDMPNGALVKRKMDLGISSDMASCHTAEADGYAIEGHVPAADIKRLLAERPDAVGLAVPGMPYGSPGMGPETEREAYTVFLIRKDGTTEAFASYPAA